MNRYAYAGNDPINRSGPEGHTTGIGGVIGAIIGGIIGGAAGTVGAAGAGMVVASGAVGVGVAEGVVVGAIVGNGLEAGISYLGDSLFGGTASNPAGEGDDEGPSGDPIVDAGSTDPGALPPDDDDPDSLDVPRRAQSRVNRNNGDVRAGWRHVQLEHFNPSKVGKNQVAGSEG